MDAAANKRSYIRLGAIRLLLKAISRTDVCMIYNRSDRMVRLWIEMFNRGGIDALATKKSDGRPRKVKMERLRDLLAPVLENPAQAGQRHWTGIKLHGWLLQQLQIDLGYRTVLCYLHELDYNLRVPRPWPDRQDEEKRAAFLLALRALRDTPCEDGKTVELWYGDESGVEGDPLPRRRWTQRGSRPRAPYLGTHIRANVVGVVCPENGLPASIQRISTAQQARLPKPGRLRGERASSIRSSRPTASLRGSWTTHHPLAKHKNQENQPRGLTLHLAQKSESGHILPAF